MNSNLKIMPVKFYIRLASFLREAERAEESASTAAITGIVLVIIIAVLAIFRDALTSAFNMIKELLTNWG